MIQDICIRQLCGRWTNATPQACRHSALRSPSIRFRTLLLVGVLIAGNPLGRADAADAKPAEDAAPNAVAQLAEGQQSLAEKYQTLELLMLKMAEFDASSNPQRSALLKNALLKSKDEQISQKMADIVAMLQQEQLRQAGEGQGNVRENLAAILELLLNENRSDRLKDERERVRRYIQDVERVLRLQRGVQGRTEAGLDTQRLSQDQSKIADRTEQLNREIKDNELKESVDGVPQDNTERAKDATAKGSEKSNGETEPESEPDSQSPDSQSSDSQSSDSQSSDSQSSDSQSSDSQSSDGNERPKKDAETEDAGKKPSGKGDNDNKEPNDNNDESNAEATENATDGSERDADMSDQGKPSEGKPSEGKPSEGKPSEGKPGEGASGEGPPSDGQLGEEPPENPDGAQPSFPGQKEIEQAEQQMREAQKQLDRAEREGAIEAQKKARQLLEQAKAQLEEILRQMREEEVERALAMLETRFRKMLEMQIKVFEDTEQLAAIPEAERGGQVIVRAGKLSVEERNILMEVDKALLLLREEGSSVAFPEAVEQLREDMAQIVERLAESKVDILTIGLEQDAIDALEEIVEALQKAQQDAEQRRQQPRPPPGQPGGPRESPLVDAIAELKMIRALQMRVNRRTQTYSRILADPDHEVGQATDEDLVASLQALAEREDRIQRVTRDIVLEKNK